MTKLLSVYVTVPDLAVAEAMAQTLVAEKRAACVNILPGVISHYVWEGKVERTEEVAMLIKTRADAFDSLAARIRALHPYDCPCIEGFSVEAGAESFLNWVEQSVPVAVSVEGPKS